jgi:hypothetical protein
MSIYNDYCNESIKEFEKKTGVEMTPDRQNLYRLAYNEGARTWNNKRHNDKKTHKKGLLK